MKTNISKIKKQVEGILPKIKEIRHHLHANPELSLKEFKTSDFIRNQLKSLDIKLYPPFLETDVVAILKGNVTGKNVTLRADIDALPLQEENNISYKSKNKNIMHACGHDGHTAMVMGAAFVLEKLKESFAGSVRFVFQPGEEIAAAGKALVDKGILNDPKPDAILALHSWPDLSLGTLCSKAGPLMAAADFFKILIKGKGGHGAKPEETIDPILIAANVINRLYLIPSRKIRALDSLVISVCNLHAGTNKNVIPGEVTIEGTIRYLSKEIGKKIPLLFEDEIKQECKSYNATYELEYKSSYMPTINHEKIINKCKDTAQKYLGKTCWLDAKEPTMGSEDFSFYIDKYPGAMIFLGMGEKSHKLHNNFFNFNDDALRNGIIFLVASTLELLE